MGPLSVRGLRCETPHLGPSTARGRLDASAYPIIRSSEDAKAVRMGITRGLRRCRSGIVERWFQVTPHLRLFQNMPFTEQGLAARTQ